MIGYEVWNTVDEPFSMVYNTIKLGEKYDAPDFSANCLINTCQNRM